MSTMPDKKSGRRPTLCTNRSDKERLKSLRTLKLLTDIPGRQRSDYADSCLSEAEAIGTSCIDASRCIKVWETSATGEDQTLDPHRFAVHLTRFHTSFEQSSTYK